VELPESITIEADEFIPGILSAEAAGFVLFLATLDEADWAGIIFALDQKAREQLAAVVWRYAARENEKRATQKPSG